MDDEDNQLARACVDAWAYETSMRNQTLLQSVEVREMCAELLVWFAERQAAE